MPCPDDPFADFATEDELAQQLNKTTRTLERWRKRRVGPPVTWFGRQPRYHRGRAHEWALNGGTRPDRARKR
jgi:hypothetical protein